MAARAKNNVLELPTPEWLLPFFQYGRYKGACGGRSSGKSHGFAEMLVEEHLMDANTSSVCVREIQKSIQQSVKRLLEHKIEAMNAGLYFTVQDAIIKNNYGRGIIIFQGLQNHTADSIKSLEGFDRVWVEEAQSVSQWSMDILRPTFRKPGSEMWFTWNPRFEDDAVEKLFRPKNGEPPKDTILQVVNYLDNPFCPREAIEEAEYCARHDPDRYSHIWMGDYLTNSDARVFNNFEVREFELPEGSAFRAGVDWGFACINGTARVETDKGGVPMRDIKEGDMVLTRAGYRKVLKKTCVGMRDVVELDCGYSKIVCTPDHKIFTSCGWKRADELSSEDEICVTQLSLMEKLMFAILMAVVLITTITSGRIRTGIITKSCTERCGERITEKSLRGITFTILTATHLTTALKTLLAYPIASTRRFINALKKSLPSALRSFVLSMGIPKRIGAKDAKSQCEQHKSDAGTAPNAEKSTPSQTFTRNTARRSAGKRQTQGRAHLLSFAKRAARILLLRRITRGQHVLARARIKCLAKSAAQDVFDLTIEGQHEFFANGLLVHNCDPTAAVRCCLDGRTLYIDHEAYKVNCEIMDTPDLLLANIPDITRYPAVADSARPETISYVRAHGIPRIEAAKKGKDSVEEGVEWLRSLRIVIHPRCKNTIYEFSRYMYKVDERTNDVLPQLVDKDNHCIAEGEKVLTLRGNIPIENVRSGDLVLTRKGFKRVLFAGITDRNRLTMAVYTTNGKLRCTPDHKVFTANRGFVRADNLRRDDELVIVPHIYVLFLSLLGMAARLGGFVQKAIVSLAGIIESRAFVSGRVRTLAVNASPVTRVYDLTVDGQHEFFASRILVSNCIDAARYACEAWRKPAPLKIKRDAIKAAWNKRRR